MSNWVYKETERWTDDDGRRRVLYTVGWEDHEGNWHGDSDWEDRDKARERVAYLNGN